MTESPTPIPKPHPASARPRPWYGVVVLPPARIADRLHRLRDELRVRPQPDEPHITIKMPFQVRTTARDVLERIAQVTRRTPPITVSLQGIGGFPGPYAAAVYATIAPNPRLLTLHHHLVEALHGGVENVHDYADEIELESYVPHITIASDLSEEEFGRLMSSCFGRELRGRFVVDQLILMRRGASEPWQEVQTFRLGGQAPRRAPTQQG